jgi:inosine-uridine nucleoside N-ribohydrolase
MLHDPLAVAMSSDPSFCETEDMCIEVDTRSNHIRGATIPTRNDPNATVCVSVDADRFMSTFVDTLTQPQM